MVGEANGKRSSKVLKEDYIENTIRNKAMLKEHMEAVSIRR